MRKLCEDIKKIDTSAPPLRYFFVTSRQIP